MVAIVPLWEHIGCVRNSLHGEINFVRKSFGRPFTLSEIPIDCRSNV